MYVVFLTKSLSLQYAVLLRERLVDVTDNLGTSLNLQSITANNFLL